MNDDAPVNSDQALIDEAVEFLHLAEEAEAENRRNGLEAIRFRHGFQWPAEIMNTRQIEQRPCLTINKTDAYCLQVANQQRQQRPRIKVEAAGGGAKKKTADVIKGMIRHIENSRGGGDLAYDTAFDSALTAGWGYWRIMADYVQENGFEQELFLAPIDNIFSVYRDPDSTMPDGSDMERLLITDIISKRAFRQQYPGKDDGANFTYGDGGDKLSDWVTKEDIRIAEFYKIKRVNDTLLLLSDGSKEWKSQVNPGSIEAAGLTVDDERASFRSQVCWYKLTAIEIIDYKELPGKYIPVVPMYGKVEIVNGKRLLSGIVKNAMDPARAFNYWNTAATEAIALAAKPKWLMVEGQDDGHETEWATANISTKPVLRYSPVDVNGQPAPPPERIQPEPPPAGILTLLQQADHNLTSVLGIVDPAMRIGGNVSGKALNAERMQSDNSTYHFYDNMTRTMRFTGEILLDLIPYYYSEPGRIVRIVGDDGRSSQETINQDNPSPGQHTPGPIEAILNDVTVGEYDVVMDTGPGYNTKRQEALAVMGPMFEGNEELMKIAGDVFFRNMDFNGSDVIADRMAAANPLAQIDEQSEIPPGVQMKMKQMEQTIQQLQGQNQAMGMELKYKGQMQQQKDEAATRRTLIETTAKVHANDQDNAQWARDTQATTATKRHDTEVRALTAVHVAEINQTGNLLKTSVDNTHDMKRMDHESSQAEKAVKAKSDTTET